MINSRKYYITTPIYYVNAEPHIGTAYTTIAGDVMARYKRLCGYETFYLTGTDEHGQKILRSALSAGLEPKELADRVVTKYKEVWEELNIKYTRFIRTTEEKHKKAVQFLFRKIDHNGDIYKGKYSGWYCTACERYITLKESPDKKCPVCQRQTEFFEEENYFFKLSKYQDKMLSYLREHKDFIEPSSRYNEIFARVKMGLEDVSVSRASFDWGITMPIDEKHVIWVWFDALTNYLSGIGYPDETDNFKKFWPANVHLIAKDILWFHSVIWPCMLMSAGLEPPCKIFAHGWWTMNADKISKSKGNVVYPRDVIDKFGVDGLRYFLLREIPFGLDGDFSFTALKNRYNNELGNELGNLVMRTVVMVEKYSNSTVPQYNPSEVDKTIMETLRSTQKSICDHMEHFRFSLALENIWEIIRMSNKYIDNVKPWLLAKEKLSHLNTVLYTLTETLRIISIYLMPFMPASMETMRKQLGVSDENISITEGLEFGQIKPGTRVSKGNPLFPRVEDK
ncbi:MAG: methionine--tRNA ligase [Planctomycetota bacterium]|nr:methionine--tRNA ligase [Planctomycetota bacterium]MDI6787860.1 methionine--tRNA ligase [Planctomycetota bacterium]